MALGDPLYAEEKFGLAVYALATGTGRIGDRLFDAFTEIVAVSERDMPAHLRADYKRLRADLTKKPAEPVRIVAEGRIVESHNGRLGATLRRMRNARAQELAATICRLADQLRDHNATA